MRMTSFAAVVILFSICTSIALAQDKPADKAAGATPSQEEMMAMMMKLGTPGAEHEKLKSMEGTFDAEVTCQMDPSASPMISRGKMVNRMIMGGRFLQGEFSGEFMGQPFNGISLMGFDNNTKKYTTSWIDSMSTAIMTSTGTGDSTGRVITCTSTVDCPIEKRPKTMKQVTTIVDNDHHTYEMYDVKDGKEFKAMTIKYTRSKDARASH